MYNVIIIGAGPAGIFSALELVKLKKDYKILIIEKGPKIEDRKCFIREGAKACPSCKKCGLLCGWGGAGAFSDGKLTLTPDVGGHLDDYMPREDVEKLIKYTDDIYLEYGATNTVYGLNNKDVEEISRKATLAELKLIYSPVRHLGTERSLDVLKNMPGLRIIMTPGMVELGDKSYELNKKFGTYMKDSTDIVILVGKKITIWPYPPHRNSSAPCAIRSEHTCRSQSTTASAS